MTRLLPFLFSVAFAATAAAQAAARPPVPAEPFAAPGGPYAVGTREYHWIDTGRPEIFTKDTTDRRHVMVQVWYPAPAPAAGTERSPWIRNLDEYKGSPEFKQVAHVRTNSVFEAPLLDGKWPVLIYNHGGGWTRWSATFTTEMLASHGYVVFAVDHAGFNKTTDFPDGYKFAIDTLGPPKSSGDVSVDAPAFFDWLAQHVFPVWVADSRFVLDQVGALARDAGPFQRKLDLDKVGALGWSFGGATAVELTTVDPRVKVGIDQDGQLFGNIRTKGSARPVMLMHNTDDPVAHVPAAQKEVMGRLVAETRALDSVARVLSTGPFAEVWIERTGHGHFSDLTFVYRPDSTKMLTARRAHEIINGYTLAFFDRYLRGKSDVALPVFPEARMEERR